MSLVNGRQSFTVPAGAGSYAPERIYLAGYAAGQASPELNSVTVLIEQAVATASVELWLLKPGADPTADASYFYSGDATTTGNTWPLAGWRGAQIRVKSGGTAGTAIVIAAGD